MAPCRAGVKNLDFLVGQVVEVLDQAVDLAVGGVDLALEECFVVGGFGGLELPVQLDHPLDSMSKEASSASHGRIVSQ